MTSPKKVFDLRAHRDPVAGSVVANDGKEYEVLKFNGDQYQRVTQFTVDTQVTEMFSLAHEVVPSIELDELMRLDREQVNQVLIIAGQGIAAVEALFPNVESPGPSTSPG